MKKIALILSLFLLASCAQKTVQKTVENNATYNPSYELEYTVPDGWSSGGSLNKYSRLITISNKTPSKSGRYLKMEIYYGKVDIGAKPVTCTNLLNKEEFRENYSKILECNEVEINGIKYTKAKIFSTVEGDNFSLHLYALLDDGTTLAAYSYSDNEKDFPVFEEIAQSFRWRLK
ncbi:hypothetical protein HYW83_01760 [Candidatus Peregrinibacteria bacterium]|nr:hypothetical protein [Candidatus Peregrinibacteria bacterium]